MYNKRRTTISLDFILKKQAERSQQMQRPGCLFFCVSKTRQGFIILKRIAKNMKKNFEKWEGLYIIEW